MFDETEFEKSLLIINCDAAARRICRDFLGDEYVCDEAESPGEAIEKIRAKQFAVALFHDDMTDGGGAMIEKIKAFSPRSVIIVSSAKNSAEYAVNAFRAGVFDYLPTPFDANQIRAAVARAIEHYELKILKERYQYHLEELVSDRTLELDKALEEIENSYRVTLKALVQALETRDFETHGHSERVVTFSLRLGYELGLDKDALRNLELGALLHDIGKIGVPDAILRKPAKLNADEWEKMRLHPVHGQRILRNISFLEGASRIVAEHHEQWDGNGYPLGLRGQEIDLGARIFAAVDAFDAMISDRVYRRGRSYEDALAELERCAGTQFDPQIVEAFKNIPREDWEVLRRRSLHDKQEILSFQTIVAELVAAKHRFELVH